MLLRNLLSKHFQNPNDCLEKLSRIAAPPVELYLRSDFPVFTAATIMLLDQFMDLCSS